MILCLFFKNQAEKFLILKVTGVSILDILHLVSFFNLLYPLAQKCENQREKRSGFLIYTILLSVILTRGKMEVGGD